MKAVVEVRNVSMTYQSPNGEIHALENISFSVDERRIYQHHRAQRMRGKQPCYPSYPVY